MFCLWSNSFKNKKVLIIEVWALSAAAAATIEEKRRFNFGRAAIQPQFGRKRGRGEKSLLFHP